jgi:hypothetical protein
MHLTNVTYIMISIIEHIPDGNHRVMIMLFICHSELEISVFFVE